MQQAGVKKARGVSINASNDQKTADEKAYAKEINKQPQDKYRQNAIRLFCEK